jgi:hypothetical protein
MVNRSIMLLPLLCWHIPGMAPTSDWKVVEFQPWWLDLLGPGVLLAGLWAFHRSSPKVESARKAASPPLPRVIPEGS